MRPTCAILLALALGAALPAGAADWYVDDNCTATQDGSSANPFCTIQDGILAADPAGGDTVRVKAGTYHECITTFATAGVAVIADDVNAVASTVIDGNPHVPSGFPGCADVASGGPYPAVELTNGSRLEGITVRGGADAGVFAIGNVVITRNVIEGNTSTNGALSYGYGGGISFFSYTYGYGDVAADITNNTIRQNSARQGGGISAFARAEVSTVSTLRVVGNTVSENTGQDSGGGIDVATESAPDGIASAVITKNIVTGNSVTSQEAYYGYGAGLWARTLGSGQEDIRIGDQPDCDPAVPPCRTEGNTFSGNTSTTGGGGMSVWLQAGIGSHHTVSVQGNTVTGNIAQNGFGGGMELFYFTDDMGPAPQAYFFVAHNDLASNTAGGQGGGISLLADLLRTEQAGGELKIENNILRSNIAGLQGGGAHLLVVADADPDLDGITGATQALVQFENNLVRTNDARTTADGGSGGGVQLEMYAFGPAVAEADLDFNTIVDNRTDLGGGGVDLSYYTAFDTGPDPVEGLVHLGVANSLIVDNEIFGMGGTVAAPAELPPSTDNVEIEVRYTDLFGNDSGSYENSLFPLVTETANLSADPQLNANYVPSRCGPAQDAADPDVDPDQEPAYNGVYANLGHTGRTSEALQSLPDIDGDGRVDGLDILPIAASYTANPGDPHYNVAADLDRTPPVAGNPTMVDGIDLGLVASAYGQVCP